MAFHIADSVWRARHHSYTAAGIPVLRKLDTESCRDFPIEFPESRHVEYTAAGVAKVAMGLYPCCRGTDSTDMVPSDCYPGGLSASFQAFVQTSGGCVVDGDGWVTFTHGGGGWTATVEFVDGVSPLELTFSCDPLAAFDSRWIMTWGGCSTYGDLLGSAQCSSPLTINWMLAPGLDCCPGCDGVVTIIATINCVPLVFGRHVGYTAGNIPIMGLTNPCPTLESTVELACCSGRRVSDTLLMAISGCVNTTVLLTWDPVRFGRCSTPSGAWTYTGDIGGFPSTIDYWCSSPLFSPDAWSLAASGCISTLSGPDLPIQCDPGLPYIATGSGFTFGDCCPGGAAFSYVITEP
jgi:hypothetical protein